MEAVEEEEVEVEVAVEVEGEVAVPILMVVHVVQSVLQLFAVFLDYASSVSEPSSSVLTAKKNKG